MTHSGSLSKFLGKLPVVATQGSSELEASVPKRGTSPSAETGKVPPTAMVPLPPDPFSVSPRGISRQSEESFGVGCPREHDFGRGGGLQ